MKYNFFIVYSNEDKSIEREAVFAIDKEEILNSKPIGVLVVLENIVGKINDDAKESQVINPSITIEIREQFIGKIIYQSELENIEKVAKEIEESIK